MKPGKISPDLIRETFQKAAFMKHLGIELIQLSPGQAETAMPVREFHTQAEKYVHAGVLAAIADHTAGTAAATLLSEGQIVLSIEFKINMLRPGIAESLRCLSNVLKPGKTITVCESEVFALNKGREKLISKATVTLAIVSARSGFGE